MRPHLIMPMGGKGSRFTKNGYVMPKPLIEINGKPFLYWAARSVTKFIDTEDTTFVVLQQHIDEFAIENAIENGELNKVEIDFKVGDDKELKDLDPADVFLANINLNVITENLHKYVAKLKPGGKIFLSGFLNGDREAIMQEAERNSLKLFKEGSENNWMVMGFIV